MKSSSVDMVPPEVLRKAISDILKVELSPALLSDRSLAAAFASLLLNHQNPDVREKLCTMIAAHYHNPMNDYDGLIDNYRNVKLQMADPIEFDIDPFENDLPSESFAERHLVESNSNLENPDVTFDLYPSGLNDIDKSYVTISPESLGFHPMTTRIEWSNDVETKWKNLFSSAEDKLVSRSSSFRRIADKLNNKYLSSTKQAAKNYTVFNLEVGEHSSAAHFIFDPSTLYVVVVTPHAPEFRFEVSVDDTENLANELVKAFKGEEDYAKYALGSLSKNFSH